MARVNADASTPEHARDVEESARNWARSIREIAVGRLPEKLRETWVLAVGQGLPYPEVSEILGIPVGTVKSRMFQAVRLVREDLMPYVETEREELTPYVEKDKGRDHDVH